jgi:hypothetical protein
MDFIARDAAMIHMLSSQLECPAFEKPLLRQSARLLPQQEEKKVRRETEKAEEAKLNVIAFETSHQETRPKRKPGQGRQEPLGKQPARMRHKRRKPGPNVKMGRPAANLRLEHNFIAPLIRLRAERYGWTTSLSLFEKLLDRLLLLDHQECKGQLAKKPWDRYFLSIRKRLNLEQYMVDAYRTTRQNHERQGLVLQWRRDDQTYGYMDNR